MLEQTNETENVDTQTTEKNVAGGIELTDTEEVQSTEESATKKEEVRQTLRELLKNNPDYQEEFSEMMKTRLDRKDREFERVLSKYKDTENVLKSTMAGEGRLRRNSEFRKGRCTGKSKN